MEERITAKELAQIIGTNKCSVTTWLCRSEFTPYFRRDRYFKRIAINYVYNQKFRELFLELLKQKGRTDYIENYKKHMEKFKA